MLATRHGKESVIVPALAPLGLLVEVADVDTDAFGTFTGETPRPGDMLETAVAKARAGMAASGADLGVASEGAFGGALGGFATDARELIVLVDDHARRVSHVVRAGLATNQAALVVEQAADEALADFLQRVGFPAHGLVVFAEAPRAEGPEVEEKGIVEAARLEAALEQALARSSVGRARIETDMRAHLNPTRMGRIAELAEAFAARLATPCPRCGAWGYGPVDALRGLPCGDCGAVTSLVRPVVHGCEVCGHREERPRDDGLAAADPQWCPLCNP
ncbi:MAG: DUF6671 family protein [Pseudomonadales bacterium]|nr:DUF6671 family protein [Pseudomonadales bacterium]